MLSQRSFHRRRTVTGFLIALSSAMSRMVAGCALGVASAAVTLVVLAAATLMLPHVAVGAIWERMDDEPSTWKRTASAAAAGITVFLVLAGLVALGMILSTGVGVTAGIFGGCLGYTLGSWENFNWLLQSVHSKFILVRNNGFFADLWEVVKHPQTNTREFIESLSSGTYLKYPATSSDSRDVASDGQSSIKGTYKKLSESLPAVSGVDLLQPAVHLENLDDDLKKSVKDVDPGMEEEVEADSENHSVRSYKG